MEIKRYYSVDRLEGELAVLLSDEDEAITLPAGEEVADCGPIEETADAGQAEDAETPAREDTPAGPPAAENKRPLREGDILVWENGRWLRDDAEAARRRKKNAALLANLRRRSALK